MSRYLVQLWNLYQDSLWTKSIILWIMLLLSSLKSINHEWWGLKYLWVYMYVHEQSKFKVLLTKVYIVTRYLCGCKYLKYFLQACRCCCCCFCLPRKLFMSYLMIFKCAFVICLCSLIVDICYVSRTGEAVSLLPQNLENVWYFLDASSPKASIK